MTSAEPAALRISAYAPGSIGNIGPGLDVLGCAITGAGDEVTAAWNANDRIVIADPGHPDLPDDPSAHACGIAAMAVLRRIGVDRGMTLWVTKGLPLSAGQGGSGASAVAAAVAVNALAAASGFDPLDNDALLASSLEAESTVAGRHLDNLAASLLGGVICIRAIDPIDVTRVPVNVPLWFALAYPAIVVRTADARKVLPQFYPRDTLIAQLASVASMVTAFANGDAALLGRALEDHVAETPRSVLVPGFVEAKRAALEAGALGASFSGSGPTTFAVCASEAIALAAAEAMRWAYEAAGHLCTSRVATIDEQGARWRQVSA